MLGHGQKIPHPQGKSESKWHVRFGYMVVGIVMEGTDIVLSLELGKIVLTNMYVHPAHVLLAHVLKYFLVNLY